MDKNRPREGLRKLFRIPVKTVGKNEERRSPESHEDAKPLGMRLSFRGGAPGKYPDGDRPDDRNETEDEAKLAELFK